MTDKRPTSITLDEPLLNEVRERRNLNLSGLVNDFLRDYLAFGDATEAHLEARLNHLEQREQQMLDDLETVRDEIEYVERKLEQKRDEAETTDDEIDAMLDDFPRGEYLVEENPAIKTWARKLDVEPQWLVEEIQRRRDDERDLQSVEA